MIEIEASNIGPEVTRLIKSGEGHLLAVLSSSLYLLSLEGYVAAVVDEHSASGPLSLRVSELPRLLDAVSGQQNLPFRVFRPHIQIGNIAHISLRSAEPWEPRLPDHLGYRTAQNRAAQTLAETIANSAQRIFPGRACSLGLADLVRWCWLRRSEESEMHTQLELHHHTFFAALRMAAEKWPFESRHGAPAERILKRLADGILRFADASQAGDSNTAAGALIALLGLGEGLTPTGDDLVSGILATLVWQARLEVGQPFSIEQLKSRIREATPQTNRISARLLHYAAEGVLYAPAMALGAALLAGDAEAVKEPAQILFSIGNTSGVDLATGILVGCLAAAGRLRET